MSVFTSIDNTQLDDFLKNYPTGALKSFTGIQAGITNSNFFVDTDTGRYVLTIVEHESYADVEWFMQLLDYLCNSNIPCAQPVRSLSGQYTSTLAEKPATLVECLQGADQTTVSVKNCESIGQVLARFHTSCLDYPLQRTDSMGPQWRATAAEKIRTKLSKQNKQLLDTQMQSGFTDLCSSLPTSVIHADLFMDNVLFKNPDNSDSGISGLIDFYYACNGCMIYDLAITFNDWCRDDAIIVKDKARALLRGYQSIRPLTPAEQEAWPDIVRCAALRFWLSRLLDLHFPPDALMTHTKDPGPFEKILSEQPTTYVDLTTYCRAK